MPFYTKEFKTAFGTYSDICDIAPALKTAAVNLSCGYYNSHTTKEYVVLDEMEKNIAKVKRLLDRTSSDDVFEYVEDIYDYSYCWGESNYNSGYCSKMEGDYIIGFYDENTDEDFEAIYATSEAEAVGLFLSKYNVMCYADILYVDFIGKSCYDLRGAK